MFRDLIGPLVVAAVAGLAGWLISWGSSQSNAANTVQDVVELRKTVSEVKDHISGHDVAIAELRKDVSWIKDGVDELVQDKRKRSH